MSIYGTGGGEKMNGINRGKITEASERLCETFEKLHLNMDERAIVAYSAYAAAKRFDAFEELEKEAGKKPLRTSKVQIFIAVCSTLAILISTIALLLK